MHELGLIDAVIRTVDKIVKEEHLTEVRTIVLEVGELSGVVPDFLTTCYKAVVDQTPYEKTVLEICMAEGTLRCNVCNIEFKVDIETLECPICHGKNLTPLTGRDLTIKEIEAY